MNDPTTNGQFSMVLPRDVAVSDVVRYSYGEREHRIGRAVLSSNGGKRHRTWQTVHTANSPPHDLAAVFDYSWLNADRRPRYGRKSSREVRLADLFCGVGGLSLGAMEAGRAIGVKVIPTFAADNDLAAQDAYTKNLSPARFETRPIEDYLNGELGTPPTEEECYLMDRIGRVDLLVGGPPCQGHSNLNNHTRRDDPKNELYARMARFAELFDPSHIIIENVPGALHDRRGTLLLTQRHLMKRGYHVDVDTLRGELVGVPQTRHRVFLVASKDRVPSVRRSEEIHHVGRDTRTFDWACSDLPVGNEGAMDLVTVTTVETQRRIALLHDNGWYELPNAERPTCHRDKTHTYVSVYGRIRENQPAPTITRGFTVMGQGRFVHPHLPRTLTPREGARLQFFPNWFSFGETDKLTRKVIVSLIGNAVPPKMAYVLALELLR